MTTLKVFRTHAEVTLPAFSTEEAACFDITAQFYGKATYSGYTNVNSPFERPFAAYNDSVVIMPGERVLVPTGLIFDIPKGYSVRIHPRSGLSYKQGLILANLEAVIDSDYYHETFIILKNTSEAKVIVSNGDRVAQGELVKSEIYKITESKTAPTQKTSRKGGLGSTGVSKKND